MYDRRISPFLIKCCVKLPLKYSINASLISTTRRLKAYRTTQSAGIGFADSFVTPAWNTSKPSYWSFSTDPIVEIDPGAVVRESGGYTDNEMNRPFAGLQHGWDGFRGKLECTRVIVDSTCRTKYQSHPGRQEWFSNIECISRDGIVLHHSLFSKANN